MNYNLKFPLPDGAFSDMSIWLAQQDPEYYITGTTEPKSLYNTMNIEVTKIHLHSTHPFVWAVSVEGDTEIMFLLKFSQHIEDKT